MMTRLDYLFIAALLATGVLLVGTFCYSAIVKQERLEELEQAKEEAEAYLEELREAREQLREAEERIRALEDISSTSTRCSRSAERSAAPSRSAGLPWLPCP